MVVCKLRWPLLLSCRIRGSAGPGELPTSVGGMKASPGAVICIARQRWVEAVGATDQETAGVIREESEAEKVTDWLPKSAKGTPSPKSADRKATMTVAGC